MEEVGDFRIKKIAAGSLIAEVEWDIKNFTKLRTNVLTSPNFMIPGSEWHLMIYPHGDKQEGWISIYLKKESSPSDFAVTFTVVFQKVDGSEWASKNWSHCFKEEGESCGWDRFCKRSTLLSDKDISLHQGTLKIFCKVFVHCTGGYFSSFLKNSGGEIVFPEGRFLQKSEIDKLEREKTELREELDSAKTEVQDIREQLAIAKSEIQDLTEWLSTEQRETETTQKDSQDLITDLFSTCKLLKSKCVELEREKAEAGERLALLPEENKDLKNIVSATKREKEATIDLSQEKSLVLINDDDSLSKDYMELFLSGVQTDITISVKDREFRTHKAVLVARSSVFRAMFEANLIENRFNHIDIDDCEPETFYCFLLFLYGDKLDIISSTNSLGLYMLADKYYIKKLKKGCSQHLHSDITVDTVCDIVQLASLHDDLELLETAKEFFLNNSVKVFQTTKWMLFLRENSVVANELLLKMATK